MANRFWDQNSVEEMAKPGEKLVCEAGELKSLLNTIVTQLADADRRHTTALSQMQGRLAAMTEEARTLKSRAPETFSSAFDRIEAGMAELSAKIAETSDAEQPIAQLVNPAPAISVPVMAPAPVKVQEPTARPAMTSGGPAEAPVALRSAAEYMPAPQQRHLANVDTFDVIESSIPRDDHDLWDQDAADALASVYGNSGYNVAQETPAAEPAPAMTADTMTMSSAVTPSLAAASAPASAPAVMAPVMAPIAPDTGWLEARFADLSRQLDQSLVHLKHGSVEAEIGHRIEAAERNIAGLLETVATRTDVEGVRLIEAHVGELVDHLDHAQRQLDRLDTIEANLADLSGKLDDVRMAVQQAGSPASASAIDLDTVASKAASAAAQRFTEAMPRTSALDGEVRNLIERHMAETRQGEENTVALLDTLQQAMIRLLDRVDAMELSQSQAIENAAQHRSQAMAAVQEEMAPAETFGRRGGGDRPMSVERANDMLDAAVAAVASTKPKAAGPAQMHPQMHAQMYSPAMDASDADADTRADAFMLQTPDADDEEPMAARSPEKMRQDFIADARRAKMRLSTTAESNPELTVAKSDDQASAPIRTARGTGKPTGPMAPMAMSGAAGPMSKAPRIAMPQPRLIVLGLALIAVSAVAAWVTLGFSETSGPAGGVIVKDLGLPPVKKPAAEKTDAKNKKEARSEAAAPAGDGAPLNETDAPQSSGEKQPKTNPKPDVRGEIIQDDLTVGSVDTPVYGVAIETDNEATYSDVQNAKRQRAVARTSEKLGQIAVSNPPSEAVALIPDSDASGVPDQAGNGQAGNGQAGNGQAGNGLTSIAKSGFSHTSPLDLPPATVGPLSLRLAAANGDPSAQFQVGSRLAEGKGNEQNFAEAAKWYQRAASLGFAQAQYRLGTLYERGLGLKPDPAKAREWYTKSAELGNVKAMHNLAVLSANQRGSSPDYETAAKWFGEAADRGLSDSQFNLAILYENGLGVTQDLKTAYKWLELATRGGDAETIKRRDILKGKLTAEDLAAAGTLVKTWKVKRVDPMINDARTAGEAWKKNPANGISG